MDHIKKKRTARIRIFIKKLGPGLITGASDDDPSGIATYSQAGSQFGLITLWTALITFPMMVSMQKMCAKIGMITSNGLATNIKKHYPKPVLYLIITLCFPAIILNIGADISGMGAVANLVFPAIPSSIFSITFTIILIIVMIALPYRKIVFYLKYLCLTLFLYLIIPFLSKQDWLEIMKNTFIPTIQFNKEYLMILVAISGTTISPYLFFWQSTMEAEENQQKKCTRDNEKAIRAMTWDVSIGMFISNLVMYFIILTTGTILFKGGIHNIETVEQAAKALKPLAGELSYVLFAIGVIGTGLLSIPVLASCLAYILCTAFNCSNGLDNFFKQAQIFYTIIALSLLTGLGISFSELSPIKALIYTAVLYGITAPPMILVILHMCNNKKIMGKFTNTAAANAMGVITFLLMSISAILLLYFQFFE